jgi:prepilin-type processing-associated H-X9-DG protein/prepilin-type N-terminal cleavage/methylation domain-containing protein
MFLQYRRKSAGFSLLELLVVIAIMSTLIAFLIPAVMRARLASDRLKCENNMRQIALAMQNYASVNGSFPPPKSYSLGWDNGSPTGTIHLWSAYLLPYLDQQPVADIYDFKKAFFGNTTAIATRLAVFQCPSAPPDRSSTVNDWKPSTVFGNPSYTVFDPFLTCPSVTMAAGDYACYLKVQDDWKLYLSYPPGTPDLVGVLVQEPDPTPEQTQALLAGGEIPYTAKFTLPSEVTDGLSNTILLIEDAGKPQFWQRGKLMNPEDVLIGAGWADPGGILYLQGDIDSGCLINCNNRANIYSFHSGGANFAFADGSVRFLSNSISLKTLVALLTAKSGDFPGSDW